MAQLPDGDLAWVLERTQDCWEYLRGKHLFITGGTGFVGSWLLECLCYANRAIGLKLHIHVLSRNPSNFFTRFPHLAEDPVIELVQGDVRNLVPDGGHYSIVIHAATDASAQLNSENPLLMADTIVEGTRRVLEFSRATGVERVIMLSSGAVYGKFMAEVRQVTEDYPGGPDPLDPYYTYSESKRMAELLCAIFAKQIGLEIPVARLFAFVGPRLPLDAHFAVGNFIRDGLAGGPIRVTSGGAAVRSYLYAAELVVWLLVILVRGQSGRAYNVGSDQALTIRELARKVADAFAQPPAIEVVGRGDGSNPVNYYVPDITRSRTELGLDITIPITEAIARTVAWQQYGVNT